MGSLEETEPELWDRVMSVNVRRRSGSLINMSSAIAEVGFAQPSLLRWGPSLALTRSMQVDCAPFGVRVNALLTGTILTPFFERYLAESYADLEESLRSVRARQLTGELGWPEDVATRRSFLLLTSHASSWAPD